MGLRFSATPEDFGLPLEEDVVVEDLFETVVYDYSEGCDIFVDTFLAIATDLVPVDTGNLMSSLDASTDGTEVTAETDCEYAEYVEYGTWKMAAQPYFLPALEEALAAAFDVWVEAREEQYMEVAERLLEEWEEMQEEEEEEDDDSEGSFIGNLLGMFFLAIILFAINTFFDAINPLDSSSHHGDIDGVDGGFIGNIESMIEIT